MTPVIIPVTVHRGREVWSLTFCCPGCGQTHYHGGGSVTESPAAGHCVSHCTHPTAPAGYELAIVSAGRAISPSAHHDMEIPG